jgi:hypothetical protein
MFEVRVINLCDRDIATNFGAVAGEVVLVDLLLFLFALIVIYFSEKKNRETKFLFATVLFIYGSGSVQNRFFSGIRYRPFVS